MANYLAAIINGLNISLCIAMLIYSIKWFELFRGGMMQKGATFLVAAVLFFLLASLARASLIWGITPPTLGFVDSSFRTVAFVCLFAALYQIIRVWSPSGGKSTRKDRL
jgi:hypothetical protein